jgi:PAS domain S-box-containing protein
MNQRPLSPSPNPSNWGALQIAGIYLLIGSIWILFSDRIAETIALNKEMLAKISLYKGWGYVIITALLLYWLIQRHAGRLHASERQLKVVINELPVLISYIDKNQRYQFANEAYEEWFGKKAQGKHIEEVVGQAIYQKTSKYVDKVLNGETVSYETEIPYQDGGERFVSATYVPDIADNGQVKGFFTLVQDISEQKEAKEKLRQWADAFEGCAHGIAIGDPDTNRIVVCNPAFANLLKCRVEDIVGSSILSLYSPSEHEHVRGNIERADQIGHIRYEAQMIRKDHSTFPTQMDLVSVSGEAGELLYRVATVQNLSEHKQAQERIMQQARLLEQVNDAVIASDENFIVTSWNVGAERIFGWQAKEVIGRKAEEVLRTEFFSKKRSDAVQELKDKGEFSADVTQLRKDGTRIHIEARTVALRDENEYLTGYVSVNRDISERKNTENILRANQEQLLSLIKEAPISIAMFDRNMCYITTSQSWISEYGRSHPELVGLSHYEVYPNLPEHWKEAHRRGLAGETIRNDDDLWIQEDGNKYWLRWTIVPWHDTKGEIGGIIISTEDISERKQAEEKLKKSEERYRYLFQNNPYPMWVYDRKTLAFLDVNEAAVTKYGYSPQEFLNMTIADIRPPEDVERLMNNLAQPRQPLEHSDGWRHRLKDGKIIHVEISSHTIDIDGHESALVMAQDITERVQAQNAIRLKDDLLHLTSEMAKVGGWEFDTKTLKGTWTDEVARIHDLEPSQGTNVELGLSFYSGESREKIEQAIQEAVELGRPYDLELEMVSAKGNYKWVRTMALPVINDGRVVKVQGIFQDITERKQVEEALRESEEKFSVIYYKAPFAAALSRLPDGVIMDVNEAFEKVYGYTKQEVIGKTSLELGINPDAEARTRIVSELEAKGSVHDIELKLHTKAGSERVFLMNIDLIGVGGQKYIFQTAQDITERKQAEADLQKAHNELEVKVQARTAALSEANALLQAMMDYVPDQIYFKDLQCRFIRNSRSQAGLMGLNDPKAVIGKTDFDFFPHAAKAYAEEQEVMRSGKPLIDFEEWVVWPDGRESWVSTTKVPLRDSDGETIGIFGISRDITERKRAEQAIQELNRDLEEQASKLQSANKELEAFSYSVSHDLRAPLRAIDGYTRILVEDYEAILDAEGKRVCGIISAEARRMGQLIDDLLAFSRLGRKEMYSSNIDMKALVVSILNELVKEEHRTRIDFHVARLPSARADTSLIRQVWINLLSNALKFTSKKEQATIEVGSKSSKDELIYYVRDTGAGFDMEYANKLFGVFQRLHSESEFDGTGVGLAIVQRIIRRHGGHVWAEGEVDKGATFYFALPRKENPHE